MPEIIPPEFQDLCESLPNVPAPWVQLDRLFDFVDYQLPDADSFTKNDADLLEIAIENGKVVRKYRSKS